MKKETYAKIGVVAVLAGAIGLGVYFTRDQEPELSPLPGTVRIELPGGVIPSPFIDYELDDIGKQEVPSELMETEQFRPASTVKPTLEQAVRMKPIRVERALN